MFISAYDAYIRESNQIGGDYYIVKPYRTETIEIAMERIRLLARRQRRPVFVQTFGRFNILKDGLGNPGMSFGGYDYSQDPPAQIGLFDSDSDQFFTYRLYVNRKNVAMSDVVVTDVLPDGMSFSGGADAVSCLRIDPETMSTTDTPAPGSACFCRSCADAAEGHNKRPWKA